jgi:DNA polymerase/3'-5' exonuclease PolX
VKQRDKKHFFVLFLKEIIKLPGIGVSLAKKIWEILDTGSLEKLEDFQSSEFIRVIDLFGNIWGCGPTIAKQWYDQVRILTCQSELIDERNSSRVFER